MPPLSAAPTPAIGVAKPSKSSKGEKHASKGPFGCWRNVWCVKEYGHIGSCGKLPKPGPKSLNEASPKAPSGGDPSQFQSQGGSPVAPHGVGNAPPVGMISQSDIAPVEMPQSAFALLAQKHLRIPPVPVREKGVRAAQQQQDPASTGKQMNIMI